MDSREPFLNSGLVTWGWVVGVSVWGGLVSYFEKKEKFSFVSFVGHLTSASFAGLMTYLLCQYGGVPGPLTGVCCGVAAYMGTPALVALAMKLKVVRQFFEAAPDDVKDK
jgi:hypothetical protein